MTRDRAARILDPETSLEAYVEGKYPRTTRGDIRWREDVDEACRMGAEALRKEANNEK